ncbi:hypothetical protein scyTo_0001386 [Scyliorhinus torazame]|uniref:ACB domain-containing protein n=1 Tax=Scyliorhinus torazame TaxID=75743 RepID=A0A401PCH9_SCYTO|nr:hypothetical protein [Scyliorhinus torazame]
MAAAFYTLPGRWQLLKTLRLVQNLPAAKLHLTVVAMFATEAEFEKAKDKLKTLKNDPGNERKLKIYALFKQATQGPCNSPKPSMLDFVNKAKWDAWNSLDKIPKEEARQKYVDLIETLVSAEVPTQSEVTATGDGKSSFQTINVTTEKNITTILLNRPAKKNAISIKKILKKSKNSAELLKRYVSHYIDFPKPLIGVINGPAVGVAVTVLGLFDAVYSTDKATFHAPFSKLGQSPEGCSSYTFPKIMGTGKANEIILFNKKLTAAQAYELGLVTEVFPDSTFQKEVWKRLHAYAKLPKNSLAFSKQLIRGVEKEKLHAVNAQECERLVERWLSEECMNAIMGFFEKKSKL